MKIVATASETGFGPTAALTCFLKWATGFSDLDLRLDLPSSAAPLVPAGLRSAWKTTRIESGGNTRRSVHPPRRPDVLLVNFGRTELLEQTGIWLHQVFVDCVGWLNAANVETSLDAHAATLLLESFPPMELDRLGSRHRVVRPCVASPVTRPQNRDHVIVCLGGGIFPDMPRAHPLLAMTKTLRTLASLARVPNPLIFSGLGAASDGSVHVYPIDVHRRLTTEAAVVVTVPGLYGVFEALQDNRPLLLLPPTNYTQMIQYTWYRNNGLVPDVVDWCAILGLPEIEPAPIPLYKETQFVRELWSTLSCPKALSAVATHTLTAIRAAIAGSLPYPQELGQRLVSRYLDFRRPSLGSMLDEIISRELT